MVDVAVAASYAEIDAFLQAELARREFDEVTAVEAARWLDAAGLLADSAHRPGLPLRNLLRAGLITSGEQRPPMKNGKWFVVRCDSAEPAGRKPVRRARSKGTKSPARTADRGRPPPSAPWVTTTGAGHRVTMEWAGKEIETLEDLLRPELRAICIGINPALTSVERGHYYQGQSGQRFLARLRSVRLLPEYDGRWEDDAAFHLGIGQTDVVKRPTSKSDTIGSGEFAYGVRELAKRLEGVRAQLIVFTYKGAATRIFGRFDGHGFVPGLSLCGGEVFVMPGPYAKKEAAAAALDELHEWVAKHGLEVTT